MKNKEKVIEKYQNKQEAEDYIKSRYENSFFELEDYVQKGLINKRIKNNFLEIATGSGRISNQLPKSIKKGTLVDSSSEMINLLKKQARFKIIHADFFKVKLKNKFNFAFSFRFLRHLNKKQREIILQKINTSLKPSSLFIFDAVNKFWGIPASIFRVKRVPDYYFSLKELQSELEEANFSIKEAIPVYKSYFIQRILYAIMNPFSHEKAIKIIRNIDNKLNSRIFAWEWVIIAEKARK